MSVIKNSNEELEEVIDESMDIYFSIDNMEAYATFKEPKNGGSILTKDIIISSISEAGIIYGLDNEVIKQICEERDYNVKYAIAKGLEVVEGKDGYLKYYFNTSPKSYKPKLLENGEVDFKELSLFRIVEKDQLLIEAIPKIEGTEGINVIGEVTSPRKVNETPIFPKGSNIYISQDGKKLKAKIKGSLSFIKNKLSISEVLLIKGDVGTSTGNIDFNGAVLVEGNVSTGFKIIAEGDIDIKGSVEGSEITSAGSVYIQNTFNGMNKGIVKARGNIVANFVKDATLISECDIYSGSIMHSNVRCKKSLYLDRGKGLLVGGKFIIRENIFVNIIGSRMATHTEINMGYNPELFEEYKKEVGKFNILKKEYYMLKERAKALKLGEFNHLSEEKQSTYLGIVHQQNFFKEKALEIKAKIDKLGNLLKSELYNSEINIKNTLYSGVNIQIGNAYINIGDERKGCSITNENGKIKIKNL